MFVWGWCNKCFGFQWGVGFCWGCFWFFMFLVSMFSSFSFDVFFQVGVFLRLFFFLSVSSFSCFHYFLLFCLFHCSVVMFFCLGFVSVCWIVFYLFMVFYVVVQCFSSLPLIFFMCVGGCWGLFLPPNFPLDGFGLRWGGNNCLGCWGFMFVFWVGWWLLHNMFLLRYYELIIYAFPLFLFHPTSVSIILTWLVIVWLVCII